jgi:hypothetical protein
MISTLYRGKNTRIINVNPFHDDTTADEKYQFICSVMFSATEERINFHDRIVGNVKKKPKNHAVPCVDKLLLKQKKLDVLRDIQ